MPITWDGGSSNYDPTKDNTRPLWTDPPSAAELEPIRANLPTGWTAIDAVLSSPDVKKGAGQA